MSVINLKSNYIPRRDGESEEHWMYRIRVNGFYRFRNPVNGNRFWLEHWGPQPPMHEVEYNEPPDTTNFVRMVRKPYRDEG